MRGGWPCLHGVDIRINRILYGIFFPVDVLIFTNVPFRFILLVIAVCPQPANMNVDESGRYVVSHPRTQKISSETCECSTSCDAHSGLPDFFYYLGCKQGHWLRGLAGREMPKISVCSYSHFPVAWHLTHLHTTAFFNILAVNSDISAIYNMPPPPCL